MRGICRSVNPAFVDVPQTKCGTKRATIPPSSSVAHTHFNITSAIRRSFFPPSGIHPPCVPSTSPPPQTQPKPQSVQSTDDSHNYRNY